jgi:hypothetical protein
MIYSLYSDGEFNFVEQIGGTNDEYFSTIVFNSEASDRFFIFGYSKSSPFNEQGSSDWVVIMMDKYGSNQCEELGL